MPLTFKELKEFTVQQLATLKKEYEPMRGKTISIDNAKKLSNKLDVLTKDMLKKLANANIPFVSTSASSKLVTKHRMNPADIKETINLEEADELQQEACWTGYKQVGFKKSGRTGKRVPNCVPESVVKEESVEPIEEASYSQDIANKMMKSKTMKSFAPKVAKMTSVTKGDLEKMLPDYVDGADIAKLFETPMMSMNKQSPEYKQGQQAAKQGKKYIDNPHSDAQKKLNWSGGHNAYRLMNMAEERTYTVVHVGHDKEVVKANGTYDAAKKYAQMKGLKDTSGVDAHLMEKGFASDANSPEYKEGEKAAKQGKSYSDNPYMKSNSFSAVDKRLNWAGGLENAYGTGKGHVFFNIKKESMSVNEGMFKKLLQTIHDKLEREGGAAGYDDLAKEVKKEFGVDITKDTLKNMPGVRQHRDGDYILEADLSKSQVNMVHKKADDMPKKDFIKRYGKDGDSVRYATATNMVKKQLGIEEEEFNPDLKEFTTITGKGIKYDNEKQGWFDEKGKRVYLGKTDAIKLMRKDLDRKKRTGDWVTPYDLSKEQTEKGDNMNEATYKDKFKAAMKDFGINSLDDLKSDAEKKKFFKKVDSMHTAKNEELTPAQKKLPAGLQKAIAKKQGDKEEGAMKRGSNLDTYKPKPKKEEVKEMGTMNAQYEMMKKEMMKKVEMMKAEKDPEQMEMMKKEMMKEMEDMPEMMKQEMMKKMEMAMKEGFSSDAQRKAAFASGYKEKGKDKKEMMKMNAMRMPIKSMYSRAGKTGDDDMSPVNNMKLNAMIKDPHKSKEDKPMKDMNAMYMKSDVRADIKNNGGADMAKVKDAPKMQTAMKKINAMYKTEKYLDEKEGSIQNTVAQMFQAENRLVEVQDKNLEKMISDYLKKGGTISKLPPALAKGMKPSEMKPHKIGDKGVIKSMYKMKEVREFVDTYNKHFLVNFKAEELLER